MRASRFQPIWVALVMSVALFVTASLAGAQTLDPADLAGESVTVNPAIALLLVYAEPSDGAAIVEALSGTITVTLTGEAETFDGVTWWEIETPSARLAWVPETADDIPTLLREDGAPLALNGSTAPPAPTRTPAPASEPLTSGETVVVAVDLLIMYAEPAPDAAILEAVARDVPLAITGEAEETEAGVWWPVRSPGGSDGWIQDAIDGVPTFVSAAAAGGELARGAEVGIGSAGVVALIYDAADPASGILEAAVSGVILRITDGPVVIDRVRWWQVRTASGTIGWTPETMDDIPVLVPRDALVPPTPIPTQIVVQPTAVPRRTEIGIGAEVQIVSLEPAWTVRSSPSMRASIVGTVPRSEIVTITDGPQAVSESEGGVPQDFTWWQIQTAGGMSGWIQQSYYGEPILVLYDALIPVPAITCTLSTFRDVNIRSGPGTGYEQIASREGANQILAANGQSGDISVPENHWWRLADGFWIRNDQVSEQTRESCAALPAAFE